MKMAKSSGKVHWLTIAVPVGLVVLGAVFIAGGDDPQIRANIFMAALARGDAKTLAESCMMEGVSQEDILKAWQQSVKDAEYYRFTYKITGVQQSGDTAQARMLVNRSPLSGGGYDENFQLDLKKVNGKWKVRLNGLSREMYPFMPRF